MKNRIPDKLLEEIFPKKLNRYKASEELYTHLKKKILSGKLKKGQKLTYNGIALEFNVSRWVVPNPISLLKKNRLIISKGRKGSFVGQPDKKLTSKKDVK
jgi:DNA-binding GntR family transcriptional regulator